MHHLGTGGDQALDVVSLVIALVITIAVYLFISYCIVRIAKDTGQTKLTTRLGWFPVLQIYTMTKSGGLSGWWTILWFLPLANIIVMFVVFMGIYQAKGKHPMWALLMFVPFVNIFILPYLAFAKPKSQAIF